MINPIDYYNFYTPYEELFEGCKKLHLKSNDSVIDLDSGEVIFKLHEYYIECVRPYNDHPTGAKITKFMVFASEQFKHDWSAAMSYIQFTIQKDKNPYIRIGIDYYRIIAKRDRYGMMQTILKNWRKDEIKQDHSKQMIIDMPKFNDFIIVPDNKNFQQVIEGCYNLYNPFSPIPYSKNVTEKDIPTSMTLMRHVFGEQLQYGLNYMKILYENPKQILPILTLESKERETGKTTFLNWLQMIFGENTVMISPDELGANFNSMYANKNIIMIDETVVEKTSTLEKLKSITTAKSITVRAKFIQEYSVPFFGKVILCTNKVKDFMRIDDEEIRFWVRKVSVIKEKNTRIEDDLFNEIPKFLRYLEQLPSIDFSKSRMVFTKEEIYTDELRVVKEESKSGLLKDLEIFIEDFFDKHDVDYFCATPKDIKEFWFRNDSKVSMSYLRKVLTDEMGLKPNDKSTSYTPFEDYKTHPLKVTGRFFYFERVGPKRELIVENNEMPF